MISKSARACYEVGGFDTIIKVVEYQKGTFGVLKSWRKKVLAIRHTTSPYERLLLIN